MLQRRMDITIGWDNVMLLYIHTTKPYYSALQTLVGLFKHAATGGAAYREGVPPTYNTKAVKATFFNWSLFRKIT